MSQRRTLVSGPLAILEPKQGRFRLGGAKWRLYYGVLEASMPYLSLYPSNDTSDPRKCIARINIDDESSARVRDDPNAMVRDPFAAPGSGSGGSGSGGASTRPTVLQLLNVNVTKEPFSARPVTKPAKVLDIDAHSPEQLKKWVTALKAVFAWLKHGTEPPLNLNSSSFEAIGASEVGMSGRDPHHHHQQQHLQHQQHSPYHASSGSLGIPPTAGHYGGGASSRHRSPSIASGGSSLFPGGHMQPAAAPAAEGGSSYAGSIRRPSNSDAGSVHSAGYYGVRPSASFSYPTPPSPGSPVTGASPYDGHGGPIVVRGGTSGSSGSPAPYNNPVAIFPPSGGMRDRPAPIPSSGAPSTSASANGGGGAPMMLPPRAMPKSAFFPGAGGMYGGGSRPARLAIDYGSLDADDDESLLPSPIRPTARGAGIAAAASASRSRSVGPPPSGRRPVHSAPGSRIDDLWWCSVVEHGRRRAAHAGNPTAPPAPAQRRTGIGGHVQLDGVGPRHVPANAAVAHHIHGVARVRQHGRVRWPADAHHPDHAAQRVVVAAPPVGGVDANGHAAVGPRRPHGHVCGRRRARGSADSADASDGGGDGRRNARGSAGGEPVVHDCCQARVAVRYRGGAAELAATVCVGASAPAGTQDAADAYALELVILFLFICPPLIDLFLFPFIWQCILRSLY
ncbi:hypothetical protein BC828DRAFT_400197 [Blastocladiella britannica]|nr:hypothetical protein BC828DRAFT_400197 [Blastocladiella britannica]